MFPKTAIKVAAIEERMIMKRNVVNLLLIFFVLSSCSNRRKIIEAQDSAPCLTNKDHAIALESGGICYAVFKSYAPLKKLKKLQELVILESAPIDDLTFIGELPDLSSIKIGKTKITAKNVDILDGIPAKVDLFLTGIK